MSEESYRSFPPGRGHVRLPLSSREAALAGIALLPACRAPMVWLQRAAWWGVSVFGPRVLPGRSRAWEAPMDAAAWSGMLRAWRETLGGFDAMVVLERRQRARPGFSVLLVREGKGIALVRTGRGMVDALRAELEVLEAVRRSGTTTFTAPEPLGIGAVDGWGWMASSVLGSGLHRVPGDPPVSAVAAEIGRALDGLPRPPSVPEHWTPMHGDLAPWNLRQARSGGLLLFDWEAVAWGPPGADEVHYRAADAVLRRAPPPGSAEPEAVGYWLERVGERTAADAGDARLRAALLRVLRGMQPRGSHAREAAAC